VINRASLGNGDGEVRDFCTKEGIPVLMTIPFDRKIAVAYSRGQTLLEAFPAYRSAFLGLFERIRKLVS
jgi:MinD superfamily P-loop ATPase